MEHLEGQTLAHCLTRGPLPLAQAIDIAVQIAEALAAAHQHHIVHRDLKPGNVMLITGGAGRPEMPTAKLLDFGLAKRAAPGVAAATADDATATRQTPPVTVEGTILGTLHYMSPEQIRGEAVDARTDIFAMGAVLLEMIMGSCAFPGRTPMEVCHCTLYEQPPAIGGSSAATAADRVIRRALAKRPEERYATASEMAEALRSMGQIEDAGETTSVDHTWWHLGDYDRVLEYVQRRHYGEVSITNRAVRAAILSEQGCKEEAILEFREVEQSRLTEFFRDLVCMYRAANEGRREESLGAAERLLARSLDAETLWQIARVFAYFGEWACALALLGLSLERGFIVYRILTRQDPWLDALRSSPEFDDLLQRAASRYHAASAAFREAGGEQLLGVTVSRGDNRCAAAETQPPKERSVEAPVESETAPGIGPNFANTRADLPRGRGKIDR